MVGCRSRSWSWSWLCWGSKPRKRSWLWIKWGNRCRQLRGINELSVKHVKFCLSALDACFFVIALIVVSLGYTDDCYLLLALLDTVTLKWASLCLQVQVAVHLEFFPNQIRLIVACNLQSNAFFYSFLFKIFPKDITRVDVFYTVTIFSHSEKSWEFSLTDPSFLLKHHVAQH